MAEAGVLRVGNPSELDQIKSVSKWGSFGVPSIGCSPAFGQAATEAQ